MLFKPMITAALVMTLGLVAHAAPTSEVTEPAAPMTDVAIADAVPAGQNGEVDPAGFLDSVLWPEGFARHCNAMLGITASLDRSIVRARRKANLGCTAAQETAISVTPSCPTADYFVGILWPLAFDKQDQLARRISAQADCLATLDGKIY
ncbi:hypothetical protein BGZ95_011958 [Linnemannia exigua]|uniref:Uncharacterized protein n=1 Tax=Linnemannia exigua TaxID=604196 RepID=A0AAD4H4T6_9FUNG|nr:hypothetical protein BGZ95_011958 [Linnemannia exigua]